ncbi:MAG: ferritin [Sulfurovum sp.]
MISKKMTKTLNEQLNREFYSAYLYLSMSAYCNRNDFPGAANWFLLQYKEEQDHATRIYNYLIDQGAKVGLKEIAKPPKKFGSLLETYEESLDHEQSMTRNLNELSDYALKEKDHATYNLLQWFVNEQVEEEATVSEIISKLKMVGEDGYGILMIDNELAERSVIDSVPEQ